MSPQRSRISVFLVVACAFAWIAGGSVAEAKRGPSSVEVCVDSATGAVSRVAASSGCVGSSQKWSALRSAPQLCWNATSLDPLSRTRLVSVAPVSGCVTPLQSVPVGTVVMLCADQTSGVLRWPVTSKCDTGNIDTWVRVGVTRNSAPSSTTTTSTAPSAALTPSVSLQSTVIQSNSLPKVVTVTANVTGTIYFVEGSITVKSVTSITNAHPMLWAQGAVTAANTPTSIAIDVDKLVNGYYSVFVVTSQGAISAPAANIVTISVSRASQATSTTSTTAVPLSCATGGSCTVGVDRGAGGGLVFYYSASAFTSTGSDCGTNCHYLEAAPTDIPMIGISSIVWATTAAVCYARGSTSGTSDCQSNSIYSGDFATQSASRTAATAIGKGMENTNQIYSRLTTAGSVATSSYAAGLAWAYANNSKTDWFLPSKDELIQLWANRLVLNMTAFTYWSSSEYEFTSDSFVSATGLMGLSGYRKDGFWNVRPVRAG